MKQILFLCTGNYYRSRFSEYLFNDLAMKDTLNWRAISRGLALERGKNNLGALSKYARAGLMDRGVQLPDDLPYPQALTVSDLETANRVIAVDESEHRPLMQARFPLWEARIDYWQIHDIHLTDSGTALGQLEHQVSQLVKSIKIQRS